MKFRHKVIFFTIIICQLVIITGLFAQEITITEEDKVPFYTLPENNHPVNQGYIGYHIRQGKHAITWYDWQNYLDFADFHFSEIK